VNLGLFEPLLNLLREMLPEDQPLYLVGGAVRDILLNRPIHDLDFTLPSPVRPFSRRLADILGAGFYMLDPVRETARLIWTRPDGERISLDFASLRESTLEADLRGRDFTINAMALPVSQPDSLIDIMGGAADLRTGVLRACSGSTFADDPARILRAFRLSLELKLKIQPETYRLLLASVPELSRVSPERQRDELFKMLDGPRVASAIRLLEQSGTLKILAPELLQLKGLQQSEPHVLDGWEHTLAVIQELEHLFDVLVGGYKENASSNLVHGMAVLRLGMFREHLTRHFSSKLNPERSLRSLLFLAALYHDTGKPRALKVDPSGRTRFIEHDLYSEELAAERGRALALSTVEIDRLTVLVRQHMRIHLQAKDNPRLQPRTVHRYFRACGEAGVDLCLLSLADMLGVYRSSLPQERWQAELEVCNQLLDAWWNQSDSMVNPPGLVNGNDLKDHFLLENSPLIGKLLVVIKEAQAAGEVKTREEALRCATAWLKVNAGSRSKE